MNKILATRVRQSVDCRAVLNPLARRQILKVLAVVSCWAGVAAGLGSTCRAQVQNSQQLPTLLAEGSAVEKTDAEPHNTISRATNDAALGETAQAKTAHTFLGGHVFQPKNMGSPYVPLDSWIYPALDRLEAFGYVPEGILGQRPWTRMECARLISDAGDMIAADSASPSEASRILQDLRDGFVRELSLLGGGANLNARMESAYTRVTGISGQPLSDGANFTFGQTIVNDYGRPYEGGANVVAGGSGWATAGPFVGYVRAEYQYAPSAGGLPLSARQVIQQVEGTPTAPPAGSIPSISRPTLLVGYVGIQFHNWDLTFGKQELWWGADQSGSMLFSNNAAPIEMLQLNRVTPFTLPSLLHYLGPVRVQVFIGRLTGQNWVYSILTGFTGSWVQPLGDQPFIDGAKISVKPTPNFEMGMGISTILGGPGVPVTLHKIFQTLYSFSDSGPGSAGDPGSRHGGFDFAYRFPHLRNWLTLYGDAFTNDEISPWRNWNKAAVTSGIYMPRIPKVPKLDFRAEGIYSDPPAFPPSLGPGFFYFNDRFINGYTNNGNLIGSWIGRQGQGADGWATYWFTPKDDLQLNFRHEKISKEFIPNGGTITDVGAQASFWWRSTLSISASVQYEKWDFPVLSTTRQSNVSTSLEITLWPRLQYSQTSK